MKTQIYNLIILDESGSMGCVCHQTITGCNETIQTIQATAAKHSDTQEHYVSIYAFQSGAQPSRYIIKNVPAEAVKPITGKDYDPCGCTPLLDAVGRTVTDLKHTVGSNDMALGSVTIITDGYENASTDYTLPMVHKMISALKEEGWSFNFIGANIDVERVSRSMAIDNSMSFAQDEEGMRKMFASENACRSAYYDRVSAVECDLSPAASAEERLEIIRKMKMARKKASEGYFES